MSAIGGTPVPQLHYTVIIEREEAGGYHAFVPALVGCHSQGETLDETVENIKEAIALYVESLRAHNEPVPTEDILIKPVEVAA
jgi:predicted RNase H-like HicB family nuclease